jgi:adenosine deaminase
LNKDRTLDFIRKMPKVELHVHLEGAIQPTTAIELMQRNKAQQAPETPAELHQIYSFTDLTHFVQAMKTVTNHLVRLEDLYRVCREMLLDLSSQNVRYVEFDCALQKYIDLGMELTDIVQVLQRASREMEATVAIKSRLVVNLQRSHGSQKTAQLVQSVLKLDNPFIVGIGLSGDESLHPQNGFVSAFTLARESGLHRTVHAGEAMGPDSVWDALHNLHAERIDHGTRAIEDPNLLRYLIDTRIPLTQCLSSNVRLHVVPDIKNHPFGRFFHEGVAVTLNTDDPQIFEVSLTSEYELAYHTFQFTTQELAHIAIQGAMASFLPQDEKQQLVQAMRSESSTLDEQIRRSA